jgi:hypothetical protein
MSKMGVGKGRDCKCYWIVGFGLEPCIEESIVEPFGAAMAVWWVQTVL